MEEAKIIQELLHLNSKLLNLLLKIVEEHPSQWLMDKWIVDTLGEETVKNYLERPNKE